MSNKMFSLVLCCVPWAARAAEPVTRLEVQTSVAAGSDSCLDHSVRELGMSAKRQDPDRAWAIKPQFLHPAVVAGGTVLVRFDRGDQSTTVQVIVTWPGAPKTAEVQREIEARVGAMASKLAQICGVVQPKITCHLVVADEKPRPCEPVTAQ